MEIYSWTGTWILQIPGYIDAWRRHEEYVVGDLLKIALDDVSRSRRKINDPLRDPDFLNLNELNILHTTPKDLFPARYETFGGYGLSERQMAAFLPDAL